MWLLTHYILSLVTYILLTQYLSPSTTAHNPSTTSNNQSYLYFLDWTFLKFFILNFHSIILKFKPCHQNCFRFANQSYILAKYSLMTKGLSIFHFYLNIIIVYCLEIQTSRNLQAQFSLYLVLSLLLLILYTFLQSQF